jgi:hypothetical protein
MLSEISLRNLLLIPSGPTAVPELSHSAEISSLRFLPINYFETCHHFLDAVENSESD